MYQYILTYVNCKGFLTLQRPWNKIEGCTANSLVTEHSVEWTEYFI